MDFKDLALQAQAELDGAKAQLVKKEQKLEEKMAVVARKEDLADSKIIELSAKEIELKEREDKVTLMEIHARRDADVQEDRRLSEEARRESELNLKKAKELNDDATQKLAELTKREVALSEAKKTYKKEVELDVMKHVAFGR